MLFTRFVRSERNYEHEHRLCTALKLLGRLMNPGTPSDSRAGAQLRLIADSLSPRPDVGNRVGEPATDPEPVEHLKPSHARAKALYDWAIEHIDGSEDMTYADLFEKLMNHPHCDGEGLPDNAATFARYCRAAGVRRNTPRHEKGATRSVRRVSDL